MWLLMTIAGASWACSPEEGLATPSVGYVSALVPADGSDAVPAAPVLRLLRAYGEPEPSLATGAGEAVPTEVLSAGWPLHEVAPVEPLVVGETYTFTVTWPDTDTVETSTFTVGAATPPLPALTALTKRGSSVCGGTTTELTFQLDPASIDPDAVLTFVGDGGDDLLDLMLAGHEVIASGGTVRYLQHGPALDACWTVHATHLDGTASSSDTLCAEWIPNPGPEDPEPADDGTIAGDGGCATAPGSPAPVPLLLVALALAGRRRIPRIPREV